MAPSSRMPMRHRPFVSAPNIWAREPTAAVPRRLVSYSSSSSSYSCLRSINKIRWAAVCAMSACPHGLNCSCRMCTVIIRQVIRARLCFGRQRMARTCARADACK